mmetsp:Transcript_21319/g.59125  ORF Transcript_21319/g.59125 Transcript_21319/m.59125 type:complete len:244 (-) Transcript_21319:182-913(-)
MCPALSSQPCLGMPSQTALCASTIQSSCMLPMLETRTSSSLKATTTAAAQTSSTIQWHASSIIPCSWIACWWVVTHWTRSCGVCLAEASNAALRQTPPLRQQHRCKVHTSAAALPAAISLTSNPPPLPAPQQAACTACSNSSNRGLPGPQVCPSALPTPTNHPPQHPPSAHPNNTSSNTNTNTSNNSSKSYNLHKTPASHALLALPSSPPLECPAGSSLVVVPLPPLPLLYPIDLHLCHPAQH